jgi:NhaP-type Na+/H+ or K+/H+ antiporter
MTAKTKLTIIKTIHTGIWVFFNIVIFYLLYAVLADKIDKWVWICIGLILLEGIVLIVFKRMCPVTLMARRYSVSTKNNFDIFLPDWLAKHNKLIYTIIVVICMVILLYRLLT